MEELEKTEKLEMVEIRVHPKYSDVYRTEKWRVPNPPPSESLPTRDELDNLLRFLTPSPNRRVFIDYLQ